MDIYVHRPLTAGVSPFDGAPTCFAARMGHADARAPARAPRSRAPPAHDQSHESWSQSPQITMRPKVQGSTGRDARRLAPRIHRWMVAESARRTDAAGPWPNFPIGGLSAPSTRARGAFCGQKLRLGASPPHRPAGAAATRLRAARTGRSFDLRFCNARPMGIPVQRAHGTPSASLEPTRSEFERPPIRVSGHVRGVLPKLILRKGPRLEFLAT